MNDRGLFEDVSFFLELAKYNTIERFVEIRLKGRPKWWSVLFNGLPVMEVLYINYGNAEPTIKPSFVIMPTGRLGWPPTCAGMLDCEQGALMIMQVGGLVVAASSDLGQMLEGTFHTGDSAKWEQTTTKCCGYSWQTRLIPSYSNRGNTHPTSHDLVIGVRLVRCISALELLIAEECHG